MKWRLAVAGSPIAHSLSPLLHEAGLSLVGLEGTSQRVEVTENDTASLIAMMGPRFDAVSVTMPLKGAVGAYCDDVDEVAERTGSVNSLLTKDGRLYGASTDGIGFLRSLEVTADFHPAGRNVVVIGAGGASRAIVDALVEADVARVAVQGRTASNVDALVARSERVVTYSPNGAKVDLVVNTTPVTGRRDEDVVVPGVDGQTIAVDIVYEPRRTAWMESYDRQGCVTMNGLAMLAFQAAAQMTWWWGVDVDGLSLLEVVR